MKLENVLYIELSSRSRIKTIYLEYSDNKKVSLIVVLKLSSLETPFLFPKSPLSSFSIFHLSLSLVNIYLDNNP